MATEFCECGFVEAERERQSEKGKLLIQKACRLFLRDSPLGLKDWSKIQIENLSIGIWRG